MISAPVEPPEADAPAADALEAPEAAAAAVGTLLLPTHREDAVCPSCGAAAAVDYTRRDADDFCRACDFPLFWSRDRVVALSSGGPDEAGLRRLPGTAGRAALASLLCPSCAEPNPATGVTCLRCGADLHPKAVVPIVVAPEPEPELVVEPDEPGRSWWPIIIAGALAVVALTVVLLVLYV